MTLETEVAALVTASNELVEAINLKKQELDTAVASTQTAVSNLASTSGTAGASLVGYDDSTVQTVLDNAKALADYTALRAYTGRATGVRITQSGIAGFFQRDTTDTTSVDNGGTIIVDGSSRRWKRLYSGAVDVLWFGAKGDGVTEDTTVIQKAIEFAGSIGGATVLLPAGKTFIIAGDTIKIKASNVFISAFGAKIKLKSSPTANQSAMITFGDYGDAQVRGTIRNVGMFGGEVDGNKAQQKQGTVLGVDGDNSGIRIEDVYGVIISHVDVHDCDGYGISTIGSFLPHRINLCFEYCNVYNNNYDGIDIKAGLQDFLVFKCRSWGNGFGPTLNRGGMGIDIRGSDGAIVECVVGKEGPNGSGNFRIRENCGINVSLTGCHSYNAPSGTYGYIVVGVNTGTYTMTACTSHNDNIGIKHQRSNLVITGGNIRKSVSHGIFQQLNNQLIGQTTQAVPLAVGTITLPILNSSPSTAINCGPYNIITVSDGTNSVTGLVTSVDGSAGTLTLEVQSFTGSTSVASGANVTVNDLGSLTTVGLTVRECGLDGYYLDSTAYRTKITSGLVEKNGRYGIKKVGAGAVSVLGGEIKNNGQIDAAKRAILFQDVTSNMSLQNVFLGDDQATPTQTQAIQFSGTNSAPGQIANCDFTGNTSGVFQGSLPSTWRAKNNEGYKNEASVLSQTFSITTTGIKTLSITHGLAVTPKLEDVSLTIVRDTNVSDYECAAPKITGVSSTVVSVSINVTAASATAGATAKLALKISAS